jgi:hypothetical protein
MEFPHNYNGDNMLIGANNLNNDIKSYINSVNATKDDLENYILDIDEYLRDIPPFNFRPRTDGLTKENILINLVETKNQINTRLETMQGGRRKKRNTQKRQTKNKNRKVKKIRRIRTIRKRRNVKRR